MYGHHSKKQKTNLEQATDALESSQRSLANVVTSASATIQQLVQQKSKADQEFQAATLRYNNVKGLTDRLCDPCWSVFPALGINVAHTVSLPSSGLCLYCNLPLYKSPQKEVTMPPCSAHLIDEASVAMKYSNESLGGTAGDYHQYKSRNSWNGTSNPVIYPLRSQPKDQFSITWKTDTLGNNSRYGHSSYPYAQDEKSMSGKAVFLRKAGEYKEQAEKKVKELEHAIPQWREYHKQHTAALNRVNKSLQDLKARHRQVLQSKLAELGGAAPAPTNQCPICLGRQKEIAFQCGHQACTNCAMNISQCHSCRVPIFQRIRLF